VWEEEPVTHLSIIGLSGGLGPLGGFAFHHNGYTLTKQRKKTLFLPENSA